MAFSTASVNSVSLLFIEKNWLQSAGVQHSVVSPDFRLKPGLTPLLCCRFKVLPISCLNLGIFLSCVDLNTTTLFTFRLLWVSATSWPDVYRLGLLNHYVFVQCNLCVCLCLSHFLYYFCWWHFVALRFLTRCVSGPHAIFHSFLPVVSAPRSFCLFF